MRTFSEVVRDAMAERNLSLRQTATLAGVSAGYLSEMLGERTKPGEAAIRRLAKTLELDGDNLVILAGQLFPVGSTRRTAADLLARNKALKAQLEAGREAGVAG